MVRGQISHESTVSGVHILRITGFFTKETIPDLQKICFEAGSRPDTKGVLLDFREISNIDSSAFACIINFIKMQLARGVKIGLLNLKTQEEMLVDILKIGGLLSVFREESEAIAALSQDRV